MNKTNTLRIAFCIATLLAPSVLLSMGPREQRRRFEAIKKNKALLEQLMKQDPKTKAKDTVAFKKWKTDTAKAITALKQINPDLITQFEDDITQFEDDIKKHKMVFYLKLRKDISYLVTDINEELTSFDQYMRIADDYQKLIDTVTDNTIKTGLQTGLDAAYKMMANGAYDYVNNELAKLHEKVQILKENIALDWKDDKKYVLADYNLIEKEFKNLTEYMKIIISNEKILMSTFYYDKANDDIKKKLEITLNILVDNIDNLIVIWVLYIQNAFPKETIDNTHRDLVIGAIENLTPILMNLRAVIVDFFTNITKWFTPDDTKILLQKDLELFAGIYYEVS